MDIVLGAPGSKCHLVVKDGKTTYRGYDLDELADSYHELQKLKEKEGPRRTVKLLTNGGDLVDQNVTFQDLLFSRNATMDMLLKAEKEIEELKKTPLQLRDEYCKELWDKIVNTKKPATLLTRDGMTLFAGICDQCEVPAHYTGVRSRKLLGMPNLTNLWSDWRVYESKPDMSNAIVVCARGGWQAHITGRHGH